MENNENSLVSAKRCPWGMPSEIYDDVSPGSASRRAAWLSRAMQLPIKVTADQFGISLAEVSALQEAAIKPTDNIGKIAVWHS